MGNNNKKKKHNKTDIKGKRCRDRKRNEKKMVEKKAAWCHYLIIQYEYNRQKTASEKEIKLDSSVYVYNGQQKKK